jgi:hypothetical protein
MKIIPSFIINGIENERKDGGEIFRKDSLFLE